MQSWSHVKYGSGTWLLDPATLQATGAVRLPPAYPAELTKPRMKSPGLGVRWAFDRGANPDRDGRYVLRWESLGPNRDRPRAGPLPAPTMLTLYHLSREN